MKTHTTVNVDVDILATAKSLKINRSRVFEDALKAQISIEKSEVDGIDIQLKRRQLATCQSQKEKADNKIREITHQIERAEALQKKKEEQLLLAKKKEIENQKACMGCGIIHDDILDFTNDRFKNLRWYGLRVCRSCMDVKRPDEIKKNA